MKRLFDTPGQIIVRISMFFCIGNFLLSFFEINLIPFLPPDRFDISRFASMVLFIIIGALLFIVDKPRYRTEKKREKKKKKKT